MFPTVCDKCRFHSRNYGNSVCELKGVSLGNTFNPYTHRAVICPLPEHLTYDSMYKFMQLFMEKNSTNEI